MEDAKPEGKETTCDIVEEAKANRLVSLAFSYRDGESIIYGPSTSNACADYALRNTNSSRPFSGSKPFPIKSIVGVVGAIVLLFLLSCPSAIIFIITLCIVYSVYSVNWRWGKAHVREKALKIHPFVAQQTKIRRSSFIVFICATMFHILPSRVFLGITHAVFGIYVLGNLAVKAAARLRMPIDKIPANNNNFRSAFAVAQPPSSTFRVIPISVSNRKAAKSNPSKIHNISHSLCLE